MPSSVARWGSLALAALFVAALFAWMHSTGKPWWQYVLIAACFGAAVMAARSRQPPDRG